MKKIEMDQARVLRQQGYSVKEITHLVGVSKSSVSIWVRNIELTANQKKRLSEKGHSLDVIEKRRSARLANERARRLPIFQEAVSNISGISDRDFFFLGLALYWGEGAKCNRGSVSFFNSDPRIIQIMKQFFSRICLVPDTKFRGHVLLHPHLDAGKAERYWSKISGIPRTQFQKTTQQHNKASKGKKDSLPMGTFMIGVYDTNLFLKIMGWMDGTYQHIVQEERHVPCKTHAIL